MLSDCLSRSLLVSRCFDLDLLGQQACRENCILGRWPLSPPSRILRDSPLSLSLSPLRLSWCTSRSRCRNHTRRRTLPTESPIGVSYCYGFARWPSAAPTHTGRYSRTAPTEQLQWHAPSLPHQSNQPTDHHRPRITPRNDPLESQFVNCHQNVSNVRTLFCGFVYLLKP